MPPPSHTHTHIPSLHSTQLLRANLEIDNSTFFNNAASGSGMSAGGGAVYLGSVVNASLHNRTTFMGNMAANGSGGALYSSTG